jgi:two-component system sensor histidine kinase DegS
MKSRTLGSRGKVRLDRAADQVTDAAEALAQADHTDPKLAIALLGAQEQERSRLAEELHDGPAQALANAIFQMEIVERAIREKPDEARVELATLRQILARELDLLRAYINQLRPALNEPEGFDEALRDSAASITERTGLPIEVRLAASGAKLNPAARTVALRVAQEALRNVAKHADARRAWVHTSLSRNASGAMRWQLEIGDDGRGFDLEKVMTHPNRRHFGLRFMRERAELLGSELSIETNPAAGTVVRLSIDPGGERR